VEKAFLRKEANCLFVAALVRASSLHAYYYQCISEW